MGSCSDTDIDPRPTGSGKSFGTHPKLPLSPITMLPGTGVGIRNWSPPGYTV